MSRLQAHNKKGVQKYSFYTVMSAVQNEIKDQGYILANSLLFGKGNNSAKIEVGEEIQEGTIKMCA